MAAKGGEGPSCTPNVGQPAKIAGRTLKENEDAEEDLAGSEGSDDSGEHGSYHVSAGSGVSLTI
jgi:hypothetical protein